MKSLEELMDILVDSGYITAASLEMSALSYPVPGKRNGTLVERFFLSSNQPFAVRRRPHAWLEADPETGLLLQYVHCSVQDFAERLNVPLTGTLDYSAPGNRSYRELLAQKKEFSQIYGEIREFAFEELPDSALREKIRRYAALRDQVIGASVLEYYRELSPEFFQWLDEMMNIGGV